MPTVTVAGSGVSVTLNYSSDDSAPYANTLAMALSTGLQSGNLTPLIYTSGTVAPSAPNGVVFINTTPSAIVSIPTSDVGIVITGGTTTITGGGVGETVVAGSSGLTYTNITPSGSAIDYIAAGDGNNLITTSTTGSGNYQVNTGAGNDTIAVTGNAVVNAGTGQNTVSVSGGSSLIYSEGHDDITANGAGTDTINIGTGQATINPGSANLFIYETGVAAGALFVAPGTGTDTAVVGVGGGTVYGGSGGNNVLIAGAGSTTGATTVFHGGGNGDQIYATGSTPVIFYAGSGSETLSGAGGIVQGETLSSSSAADIFVAGSGTGRIFLGSGADTVGAVNGAAGGNYQVSNFGSADRLVLDGYGAEYATESTVNGEVVTLSDGTEFLLNGVTSLSPTQIVFDAPLVPCFLQGTLIQTSRGDVAVESLAVGDIVATTLHGDQPIRWIGVCTVSTRFADPLKTMPIRIKAGALRDNVPLRDLLVSPDHAMLVDDILIQAGALVNCLSIVQERTMPERFTYYHIELAEHSLILAEGAPAETFVDNVDRMIFDNWAEHQTLYGLDIPIVEMDRPRANSRRQIPTDISHKLMRRAVAGLEQTAVAA
ncbi:Hint domain-containing protein [Acidisoma silvae]|uniref:Hint domain-containing protein n=1 Tax=Acidisoma silvae TaxID=2802396 RepID=A0A963YVP1_9PROT|nr:Hint domain-containing protein [Acidisoma silvae]MCB8877257.1 Hint domain-containing protein [Acidisoma silvae]